MSTKPDPDLAELVVSLLVSSAPKMGGLKVPKTVRLHEMLIRPHLGHGLHGWLFL